MPDGSMKKAAIIKLLLPKIIMIAVPVTLVPMVMGVVATDAIAFQRAIVIGASSDAWRLNISNSTYSPAPIPLNSLLVSRIDSGRSVRLSSEDLQRATAQRGVSFPATDLGVKITMVGELPDGTAVNASYTQNTTANTNYPAYLNTLAVVFTASDLLDLKSIESNKRQQPIILHTTNRVQLSHDDRTLTIITKGATADGKKFQQTVVYEKQ